MPLNFVLVLLAVLLSADAQKPAGSKPAAPFKTDLTTADMTNKQAVVNTTAGTFVIDLRPDLAPNHVGYFIKLARAGAYNGTIFHRVIRLGIIQGGDPLSKDPAKAKLYGTGGLGVLKAELGAEPQTRGAVAAVLQPGNAGQRRRAVLRVRDRSAVARRQIHDLRASVRRHGRRPEDLRVAGRRRTACRPSESRSLRSLFATRRRPSRSRFSTEPAAALASYRAVLETSAGPITIEFFPRQGAGSRPELSPAGAGRRVRRHRFHRVVRASSSRPAALQTRGPLTDKQQKLVRELQPEFNDTKHVKGIVSMARGDDPASATTSFFIVTGMRSSLDGKYTAFGRVIDGIAAVDAIEAAL